MPSGTSAGNLDFVFRGTAVPLGGRVFTIGDRAVNQSISSPHVSSLSVVGGYSLGKSRGSSFERVFRWGNCVAESIGESRDTGLQVTQVTSSIENIRATNRPIVFTANLLKLVVQSVHPVREEPSIQPVEVVFGSGRGGMTLDGKPITVVHDLKDFQLYPKLSMFDEAFRSNQEFFEKYRGRFRKRGGPPRFGQRVPRVADGYAAGSIVRQIKYDGQTIEGHVLRLEGFGSIHFGELLMSETSRRLTMVRLRMGSDVRADCALAEVDINGSWPS